MRKTLDLMKTSICIWFTALLAVAVFLGSCQSEQMRESYHESDYGMTESRTKAGEGTYYVSGNTFSTSDYWEYSLSIYLVQNNSYSYSGFDNMQDACPVDFFSLNGNDSMTFLRETGYYTLKYYPNTNHLCVVPSSGADCLYIMGNGKMSGTKWISAFASPSWSFYDCEPPYFCVAPKIAPNTYQATMCLSSDNDWDDVRLEIYTDTSYGKSTLITSASSLVVHTTNNVSYPFELCSVGTSACNIHSTSSFLTPSNGCDGGVYLFTFYNNTNTGCWDITIDQYETQKPALTGKMMFHRYTDYDSLDSELFLYDFGTNSLSQIGASWTVVTSPMNAVFSPDGSSIVFMGIGTATQSWDIFKYTFANGGNPLNLTSIGNYRDEDPRYSPDGSKVYFKRDGHLAYVDVATSNITVVDSSPSISFNMPCEVPGGEYALYSGNSGTNSYIAKYSLSTSVSTTIYDRVDVGEYFPVPINATSFYYSANYSSTNHHDQIYIGYLDGSTPLYLPFNTSSADYSDSCPVNSDWLILSGTRTDSAGGYDLYVANINSGAIYRLSAYNSAINTSLNELGASYYQGN